jgi:acetyltransferase-like isoleucine patch superfamily enzyme
MINFIKKSIRRIFVRIGLKKEIDLSKRYPQFQIGVETYGNLKIRDFMNEDDVVIGSYTSIGPGVQIMLGAEHRADWVTTYPFNINWKMFNEIKGHPKSRGDVKIGNDVWIGTEAIIMSGVTIGDGAVIGARAIVTEDIPSYAIAVGMPAKVIRYRFDTSTINDLNEISWWKWPKNKLKKAVPDMLNTDIKRFIKNAKEGKYEKSDT